MTDFVDEQIQNIRDFDLEMNLMDLEGKDDIARLKSDTEEAVHQMEIKAKNMLEQISLQMETSLKLQQEQFYLLQQIMTHVVLVGHCKLGPKKRLKEAKGTSMLTQESIPTDFSSLDGGHHIFNNDFLHYISWYR